MKIDKSQIKRILVITLSNIGDIILTTPVVRTLAAVFPSSRIDVMVGPRGKEIFEKDPAVFKLIIYDKHMPIAEKRRLQLKLKKLKYDLAVDLRNTVFPILIGPRFRTATIQRIPPDVVHMRDRHLWRLKALGISPRDRSSYIFIPEEDAHYASRLIEKAVSAGPLVVISPGAKSHIKRWTAEGFAGVADSLVAECGASVVFVGTKEDRKEIAEVMSKMKSPALDISGRTGIRQLAAVLKAARLVITNDSAPLHIACAVGAKVLAIFGPTDPKKYGPTGEFDMYINERLSCSPCESAQCSRNYECMKLISADAVFDAAKIMLEGYE